MPILSDDMLQQCQKQLSERVWQEEVVSRLPAETEAQAKTLRAFLYQRAFACACDLLRGLLYYVLFAGSLRELSCFGVLGGIADISDRAWSKRMSQACAWLWWLVRTLLQLPAPDRWCTLPHPPQRILIVDGSTFGEEGGPGDQWRLHLSYNLTQQQVHHVVLTDRHGAESIEYADLHPGDCVLTDRGYTYRKAVAYAMDQDADYTGRFAPPSFPLLDEQSQALDIEAWLRSQPADLLERKAWFDWQDKRFEVRVIACPLAPQAAEAERKRCREKAQQHGRKVQAQTLYLAGWLLLISTLDPSEWSAEQVICLYQARWQIELLIKRIKQLLQMHRLPKAAASFNRSVVACLLLAWILQEQDARQLQLLLDPLPLLTESKAIVGLPTPRPASQWSLNALCLQGLAQAVRGMWSLATILGNWAQLQRHLCPSPRKRVNQERLMRDLLYRKALPHDLKGVIFCCSGT
jgi:hypothetical protein